MAFSLFTDESPVKTPYKPSKIYYWTFEQSCDLDNVTKYNFAKVLQNEIAV